MIPNSVRDFPACRPLPIQKGVLAVAGLHGIGRYHCGNQAGSDSPALRPSRRTRQSRNPAQPAPSSNITAKRRSRRLGGKPTAAPLCCSK